MLWCFAENAAARAFYEAQGFVVVEETDGAGNEALRRTIDRHMARLRRLALAMPVGLAEVPDMRQLDEIMVATGWLTEILAAPSTSFAGPSTVSASGAHP